MSRNLKMKINPIWDELDLARKELSAFLDTNNVQIDHQHSVIMISSELLENAIKYGDSNSGFPISIETELNNNRIMIEVKNKIMNVNSSNLKRLDHDIQWIKGFQSPFEAYIEKLKKVSAKDLEDSESGLGLVRIAYEGRGELDFYLDEDEMVCISAVVESEK